MQQEYSKWPFQSIRGMTNSIYTKGVVYFIVLYFIEHGFKVYIILTYLFKFWYLCIVLREGRKEYCSEYKEKFLMSKKCCCRGWNFRASFFSRRGVNLYFGDTINYSVLFFVCKYKHILISNKYWCFFPGKLLYFQEFFQIVDVFTMHDMNLSPIRKSIWRNTRIVSCIVWSDSTNF